MSAAGVSPALAGAVPARAAPPRSAQHLWLIAIVVTMATFMEVLDTTIINVALPHIGGNLSAGQDESTWVLTSYLVSNAIVLPISGWLSTVIGRKRFYMGCVTLFTLSSFLCGLAPSLGALIFFRVLQGLGGGGLQPSEQAILVDTFPAAKRGMAFAIAGIATVVAPVLGPTLGGWITDNYSWRWCFYINLPVGILSLVLTHFLVHDSPDAQRQRKEHLRRGVRIDFTGLALIATGLGLLQVVLDKGEREDWFQSHFILILSVISGLALISAVVWLLRARDPIVDLHLLKEPTFAMANVLMFVLGFVMFGSTVLIPLLLQTLMGYTATWAGLALSPGGLVVIVVMPLVGFLVSRVQPKWLITFGLVAHSVALLGWMTNFNLDMSFRSIVVARCVQTFGIAFLFVPINSMAYSRLPPGKNNNASALVSLSRNMGASFGIAFVATWLVRRTQFHQQRLISHLTPFDPGYQSTLQNLTRSLSTAGMSAAQAADRAQAMLYATVGRQAAMLAYIDDFWILGVAFLLLVPLVLLMRKMKPPQGAMGH